MHRPGSVHSLCSHKQGQDSPIPDWLSSVYNVCYMIKWGNFNLLYVHVADSCSPMPHWGCQGLTCRGWFVLNGVLLVKGHELNFTLAKQNFSHFLSFYLFSHGAFWLFLYCVAPENIHTSPMEVFFHLNTPTPLRFPVLLHTFPYKFWPLRPPPPWNFQWPSMGWVWIFPIKFMNLVVPSPPEIYTVQVAIQS